jgi:predicted helicase
MYLAIFQSRRNMSLNKVLEKYRNISYSERDKGNRFERLMKAFLQTDPHYASKFKKVWLWNEFPGRKDLGGIDTGIDLVALNFADEYWAIQCKCFQENATIDRSSLDSFLATSSREFTDDKSIKHRFSQRLWISTSNNWGSNAELAIKNQNPPFIRLNLSDLSESPVDWDKLENGVHGDKARKEKKKIFPHVLEVTDKVVDYFKDNERGRLIMACGTGKTMTALKIAEKQTNHKGQILFLVPSIALIGQTLREWTSQSDIPINPICICSDPAISSKKSTNDQDATSSVDLAWPASTDPQYILKQFNHYKDNYSEGMTVVFSTYQSIEVIADAQKVLLNNGFSEFDIIICDEAHRTTGFTEQGGKDSPFVKVHDSDFLKAKKRLYMTATPRLYDTNTQSKAEKRDIVLWSMDDEKHYGKEIHRIGFGEAVDKGLLTDYKVLILTLSDNDVPLAVQNLIAKGETQIDTDDLTKLIGTISALSKKFLGNEHILVDGDSSLMKRAVAFCQKIDHSKDISNIYSSATDKYLMSLPEEKRNQFVNIKSKHMDGTFSAPERDRDLAWLKEETPENECRIITNVRVLSEGVDVPSLDAVLFIAAKNSQVDVVQSVGRVMRKSPGKKYGYIIIPVVVPTNVEPENALDDDERYKIVWTVLNALRAHDDRFNATVNKIELNKKKPNQILVGGVDTTFDSDGRPIDKKNEKIEIAEQFTIQFEHLQNIIYARMVQKVGNKRYWEQWARDVAIIAERQIERINYLISQRKEQSEAFEQFLIGLQKNINPSINQQQAVEMLAQHIITKPIFDALFEGYSFVNSNAVSVAMQSMIDKLEKGSNFAEQDENLIKFYDYVKNTARKLDNAEAKQRIIIELYDKFFKTAFPKMVEKLGIVYTPLEVVDFIINSVNDILQKEFKRSISDENIHILDPFTGTGTFMVQLIQSGLIDLKDIERKYKNELHANEIVLLAYYIAAVNIENAYHDTINQNNNNYSPFDGIVLTDTFQLAESDGKQTSTDAYFERNSDRVTKQRKAPLRIIIGNPPYSVGQRSTNDGAENQSYPKLDSRIASTYAKLGNSANVNSLYDSYIKSFRWSTDRLDKTGGIICFVSNGAWLDGNSTDGFRKAIENEFTSIYVFNLRGNARTSGELRQKEAGNVFGSGSRTPISITLLVKNPDVKVEKATIHYHDIGDYLDQKEKLKIVQDFKSFANPSMALKILQPNEHGDWLNMRNDVFESFIPLEPEKKFDKNSFSFFTLNSLGVFTNRDAWSYNFSREKGQVNISKLIAFYNKQVKDYKKAKSENIKIEAKDFIDKDPTKISWTSSLIPKLEKGITCSLATQKSHDAFHRPYTKEKLYFGELLIHRRGQFEEFYPNPYLEKNSTIFVTGIGSSSEFSTLITNIISDGQIIQNCQCFPLYYYEESNTAQKGMFNKDDKNYIRRDGISDFILNRAQKQYGKIVTKEDIFYYVYGFLHSKEYRETFANDLKKMLPRLPLVDNLKDFWAFSKAGRQLADLHLNYENVEACKDVVVMYNQIPQKEIEYGLAGNNLETINYKVQKMRFPSKTKKDVIYYNHQITLENIPLKAYEYIVNGKSAIDWIMDRYQITTHKESGIINNPNDWADEVGNPRYILDLLLSIINVSVMTVDIVNSLPKVKFE